MPLVPFVPPPPPEPGRWVAPPGYGTPTPPPPPRPHIRVSQLPTPPRRVRWWLVITVVVLTMCAALLFEPVRILAVVLLFFWIAAIGMMPHVAVIKTIINRR
jgi:hypothetical protein